ncbi:outer membrane protein assembly factor BamB [Variovorax soli]|uniref:outer membrane protein assembly factor BamB n=1 Tax=Variovorax soli TaxID=376815 RepID=UPI0008383259|nr:outer membrane protein assembly factor BamB [Variovorax soli]
MNLQRFVPASVRIMRGVALAASIVALAACGSSKPKPAELPPKAEVLGVRLAWSIQAAPVGFALVANVSGDVVTVAGSNGTVVAIDARNGKEMWRAKVDTPILAGVGSDGTIAAVVTNENELVALQNGKVLWKQKLTAETFTPPLVAGRRIFVQTADRTTTAWDGQSGRRLWTQTRTGDNLVLKRPGVMLAVGDTLVAGVGGRLVGMNPANGSSRWEAPIASPRGTNDVERLVDLTGTVSRLDNTLCARAYMATIGCVDASRGVLLWTKTAQGSDGLSGDERALYGTESNGIVTAWRRSDGERLWSVDAYKYRSLTAPLAVGRTLILGEGTGQVLFLNREDGSAVNRVSPDGSAIAADPVLAANTVVVVTRKGGVFGYRPE